MPRDYYEVLGITKDASTDEIKRAYRKLAREHHPDVSSDPKDVAEEKFKEISEAYEVLSDEDTKRKYDQYGHAGVNQQFGSGGFSWDNFTHFEDISDIFGGGIFDMFFGGGNRRKPSKNAARQGESLRYDAEMSLEDVLVGKDIEIAIPHTSNCTDCKGTGGKNGDVDVCKQCGGNGQVQSVRNSPFGQMVSVSECPSCRGAGKTFKDRCPKCKGSGRTTKTTTVSVSIPKGIEDGMRLRVQGKGDSGYNGGPAGDLFVVIHVKDHKSFERDGVNLWTELYTTYSKLVLGGEESVTTLDKEKVAMTIPPGTQVNAVLRIPGKGLTKVNGSTRGDLFVRIKMEVPRKFTDEERELLQKLDSKAGGSKPKRKNIFKK